jgi:hypothetical protein
MLGPLGLCLSLPSAICNKGFGGTDQEWQAEFAILKQECAQAALGITIVYYISPQLYMGYFESYIGLKHFESTF